MSSALLIFLRNPVLGQVKTRLAAGVGAVRALAVYRELLAHTRAVTQALPVAKTLYYADYVNLEDEWSNSLFAKKLQPSGDLGERMAAAFAGTFAAGASRVVIIGTDCPDISTDLLTTAFAQLTDHDVVVGPAADGGYYLLGLRRFVPELFADIAWSTAQVLPQTLQRCQRVGLSVAQLPVLSDLDTADDLAKFPQLQQNNTE